MKQSVRDKLAGKINTPTFGPDSSAEPKSTLQEFKGGWEVVKIRNYALVISPPGALAVDVEARIAEGWQPIGGASQTSDGRCMQAMIKCG